MRIRYGMTPIKLKLHIVADRHLWEFLSKKIAKTVGSIAAVKKIKAYLEITSTIKAITIAITLINEDANLKLLSVFSFDIINSYIITATVTIKHSTYDNKTVVFCPSDKALL